MIEQCKCDETYDLRVKQISGLMLYGVINASVTLKYHMFQFPSNCNRN